MAKLFDSADWSVRVLDLPKRRVDSGGRSLGDGFIVFDAKTATSYPRPFLLMDDADTAIALELEKNHEVLSSGGKWLTGHEPGADRSGKACAWRVLPDGTIERHPMWHDAWGASSPGAVHGDVFVGIAHFPIAGDWQRRGVIWPEGPAGEVICPDQADDVSQMTATDGIAFAGVRWEAEQTRAERAVYWPRHDATRVDLHPPQFDGSMVRAVSDDVQVGYVTARSDIFFPAKSAALWRGDADSYVSLAPSDSVESEVVACGPGFQVGNAQYADAEGQQTSRAVLWAGSADIAVDLHALLGEAATESEVCAAWTSNRMVRLLGSRWTGSRRESKTQRAVVWQIDLS